MKFRSKSKRFSKNRFYFTSQLICYYVRSRNSLSLGRIMIKNKKKGY